MVPPKRAYGVILKIETNPYVRENYAFDAYDTPRKTIRGGVDYLHQRKLSESDEWDNPCSGRAGGRLPNCQLKDRHSP